MRIFFATVPSLPFLERVRAVADVLRRRARSDEIRWASVEQLHFTLKFLGEQPEDRVTEAIQAARRVALLCTPFEVTLGSVGAFPSAERPRVVWVGTSAGAEPFVELANRLDRGLERVGFEREHRPFVPHLTLARTKTREGEQATARALERAYDLGEPVSDRIDRFVLMQSKPSPKGSEYSVIDEFLLGSG